MDLSEIKRHLNSEPVKYTILFLSSPIWWPFLKALWHALNDALRDEGGIFGAAPTARELANMNRERGEHYSPLTSVTWAEHESGADERERARRARRAAPSEASKPVKRGFR